MTIAQYVLDHAETEPDKVRDILIEMHDRGETVEEICEFIEELAQRKITVPHSKHEKVFDICGTGGSGKERINLSTALAIKLSQKFKIAKHGNKAASGRVGSFDLIERAGFEVSDTLEKVQRNLAEKNLSFVFAPAFHPALKHLAPIRQTIPHATIFNFLGPLLNPVEPLTAQMTGISKPALGEKLAEVAQRLNKNILFVHDEAFGLDDVSIGGETRFWKIINGKVETGTFAPEDYGLDRVKDFSEIQGGDVEDNFRIFQSLIDQTASKSHLDFLKINELVATDFFQSFVK